MVLQRDQVLTLWGWADPCESVQLTFRGSTYRSEADAEGHWQVTLPRLSAGGPDDLNISASNQLLVRDVLVGDVLLAFVQCNFQLTMVRTEPLYDRLVA